MSQELNGYFLRERLPTITLNASGVVGAAPATVDIVSNLGVTASAAGLAFTLPNPTDTRSGRSVVVMNTGTNAFAMYGQTIQAGQYSEFIWGAEDTAWRAPAAQVSADWNSTVAPTQILNKPNIGGLNNMVAKFIGNGSNIGNSQIYDSGTNAGVGTTTPVAKWDVNGTLKVTDGTQGVSKILYSDAAGLASWKMNDLYNDGGKANTIMTLGGVASFTANNEVSWTGRFIILGGGRGVGTSSTDGFFDITMPPAGTVIPGIGGAANVIVTGAGIPMTGWNVLWYELPSNRLAGFNSANLRVSSFTGDTIIPSNYVMVAARNGDIGTVKFGSGQVVTAGSNTNLAQGADFWRDGGKVNDVLTANGTIRYTNNGELTWTGRLIALGGGTGNGLNGQAYSGVGYYDINMPPVGTVIPGVGGSVSNITVTAAGIPLTSWGVLYYKLSGGGSGTVNSNFVWVGYGNTYTVTSDMVVIATINQDSTTFARIGTGHILWRGDSVTAGKLVKDTFAAQNVAGSWNGLTGKTCLSFTNKPNAKYLVTVSASFWAGAVKLGYIRIDNNGVQQLLLNNFFNNANMHMSVSGSFILTTGASGLQTLSVKTSDNSDNNDFCNITVVEI